jgi:hypothetical protein
LHGSLNLRPLLRSDVLSDRFRGTLYGLGGYLQIGEEFQLLATVIEGGILSNDRLHAPHSWRELRVLDVQFDIRGELPGVTMWAQVVRPRDFHFTDYRQHGLSAEFPVSGPLAAITRDGALIGSRRCEAQKLAQRGCARLV